MCSGVLSIPLQTGMTEFGPMSTTLNPELTEISIDRLRLRHSAKWARYPADVLPAWVAEMDFPLAEPVKLALAEAVQLDDCGYASPQELGLAEAFAGFAEDRLEWRLDPQGVSAQLRCGRRDHGGVAGDRGTG